jgi:hypothetical protein
VNYSVFNKYFGFESTKATDRSGVEDGGQSRHQRLVTHKAAAARTGGEQPGCSTGAELLR